MSLNTPAKVVFVGSMRSSGGTATEFGQIQAVRPHRLCGQGDDHNK
jgi:hypothetical protein